MEVNHSKIKETNRKKIISLLLSTDEITKLDISRELNISITTVSTNINELKEEGIIEEVRAMESTGGRKPISIKLIENCRYSIGVALTRNHIKISLINIKREQVDYIKIRHNHENIDVIIEKIKEVIVQIIMNHGISKEKLLGICFSIPGLVDTEKGIIKRCYFLNVNNYNLKSKFEYLNIPVYVNNEANLSAYYEFISKDSIMDNLLYVSITDGVGVGIIINKQIYEGQNHEAGEFGHIKISLSGKQCNCGKIGCLEAYASKNTLIESLNKINENKIQDSDQFIEKYFEEDSNAINIVKEYLTYLGMGISNLIMMLDPSTIVIGGDINKLIDVNINNLKNIINDFNSFNEDKIYNIEVANYKESYLLGAALVPIEQFLSLK